MPSPRNGPASPQANSRDAPNPRPSPEGYLEGPDTQERVDFRDTRLEPGALDLAGLYSPPCFGFKEAGQSAFVVPLGTLLLADCGSWRSPWDAGLCCDGPSASAGAGSTTIRESKRPPHRGLPQDHHRGFYVEVFARQWGDVSRSCVRRRFVGQPVPGNSYSRRGLRRTKLAAQEAQASAMSGVVVASQSRRAGHGTSKNARKVSETIQSASALSRDRLKHEKPA